MTIDDLFYLILALDVWAAITDRPTITRYCRKHRWAAIPILVIGAAHLLKKLEEL